MAVVFTIGHSTRTQEDFLALLRAHGIARLVDIRAFPMSRRHPQFNREAMQTWLAEAGIEYVWEKDLGGRRGKPDSPGFDSPNKGLRNDSFRNYADYMLTPPFQGAAAGVVRMAAEKPTAIMCAEAVYFHCHRMLVSDYLVAHGNPVLHITDAKKSREHKPTAEGRMVGGQWIYPGLF
jgi:uncharacterized protein (DUF488 family)